LTGANTWFKLSEYVGFNVTLDTLLVISGMIFTGQMTKPRVSKHQTETMLQHKNLNSYKKYDF